MVENALSVGLGLGFDKRFYKLGWSRATLEISFDPLKDLALISARGPESYNFLLKVLLVCLLHSCHTTTYTNNIN